MAFLDAFYLASAAKMDQWPNTTLPEVLFVGKSNVGKSSLINKLTARKKLAHVGKTPGKTRLLNFFDCKELMLVDAPGYGYAQRSFKEQNSYQKLMEDYLLKRDNLVLVIWILDIRRLPNEDDLLMLNWFINTKCNFICVLNKADTLSGNQRSKQIKTIQSVLSLPPDSFILFSAKTSLGLTELQNSIIEVCS